MSDQIRGHRCGLLWGDGVRPLQHGTRVQSAKGLRRRQWLRCSCCGARRRTAAPARPTCSSALVTAHYHSQPRMVVDGHALVERGHRYRPCWAPPIPLPRHFLAAHTPRNSGGRPRLIRGHWLGAIKHPVDLREDGGSCCPRAIGRLDTGVHWLGWSTCDCHRQVARTLISVLLFLKHETCS